MHHAHNVLLDSQLEGIIAVLYSYDTYSETSALAIVLVTIFQ